MKRLKNASVVFLTLLLSLCIISPPVLAEYPWGEDGSPMLGKEDEDPPGPRGGPSGDKALNDSERSVTFSSLLMEISYCLAELWLDDGQIGNIKNAPDKTGVESTKVR